MSNKTEDRFYFNRPGQKAKFDANAPWMSEVNRMLSDLSRERAKIQIWVSGSDSVTTAGSSRGRGARSVGTTYLVAGRIADYLLRVPGAVRKHTEQYDYPKKGLSTSFYKVSNLPKELIAYLKNWGIGTSPQSFSGFTGTSAVAYSRPGQPERFGLEDACWEGYEPVGTKQKDGRTVPNCVPKAKNEQPDVMATPMGEHGDIAKLASRALREGAEAYRAGKSGVLNARDPKYNGMSEKELEVYGDFWVRGWDGERMKAASARPVREGIDRPGMRSSRPGQPERFATPSPSALAEIRKASRPSIRAMAALRKVIEQYARYAKQEPSQLAEDDYYRMIRVLEAANRGDRQGVISSGNESAVRDDIPREIWYWAGGDVLRWSKPGQPDKFDASSLDRGNFAEASKSPILGKLLSEKAMPEGGWRAVQAGSDTLVISFEDADLARDFGRRVASKGYNATSPVATTGRYWNVEVKNG